MDWFYENKIKIITTYINIILIYYIFSVSYKIYNLNYLCVTSAYLIPVFIYWLLSYAIRSWRFRITIIVASVVSTSVYIYFNFYLVQNYIMTYVDKNLYSINMNIVNGVNTNFYDYMPIVFILTFLITAITFFMYDRGLKNSILLIVLAQVLFFWYLQYYDEIGECIFLYTLISAVTYIANSYHALTQLNRTHYADIKIKKHSFIRNIIIFSIIVVVPGTFLPQQHVTGVSYKIYNNYRNSNNSLSENAVSNIYDIGYSGYNESEKALGGPISINNDVVLKVKADRPYYLKGSVKDKYTGHSWTLTKSDYKKVDVNGITGGAFDRYVNQNINVKEKTIEVAPVGLSSSSFMTPMYSENVTGENLKPYYDSSTGTFANNGNIDKKYRVSFYYADTNDYTMQQYGLYYRGQKQYERYLQLPNTVTQRTVDLVYKLVKNCRTNDEKITKIRQYLENNYRYTLNAAYLPAGRDFVDYFLFEDKKGYCVHFATAMTIMYRIAGIPARFVEGYNMDGCSKKNGVYDVTNAQAHAWCEYMVKRDLWTISDAATTPTEQKKDKKKQNNTVKKHKSTKVNKKSNSKVSNKNNNESKKKVYKKSKADTKSINTKLLLYILLWVAAAAVAIASTSVLVIYIIRRRKESKKHMLYGDSSLLLYRYIMKKLTKYGFNKAANMTDMEFIEGLDKELKVILEPLARAVYAEFYGGSKNLDLDKENIYRDFQRWINANKNRKNKI